MRTKLIFVSVLLASCSYTNTPLLSPYKMDIRQGNYITTEMRDKLKLGMSKSQVRYVLGTPMVSDPFHADRWDYVYSLEQRGKVVEKQHYKLLFSGEHLVSIDDGTVVEPPRVIAATPVVSAPAPVVTPPAAPVVIAPVPVEPVTPVAPVIEPPAAEPVVVVVAPQADPSAEILASVQAWAQAWSSKDTQAYLAAYVADFKPKGMTHVAWQKQRIARITHPNVINVKMSNRSLNVVDASHATVSFTQDYSSDAYHDQVEKTLSLVKQGENWLISAELAGKPNKNSLQSVTASPLSGAAEEGVQAALKHWSDAWVARDVTQYLASYGATFKPTGLSREQWEAQRKERIGKAQTIALQLSDVQVKVLDDSHATASFKQAYRSDSYHDVTRKTLRWEKVGDAWLIVTEQVTKK